MAKDFNFPSLDNFDMEAAMARVEEKLKRGDSTIEKYFTPSELTNLCPYEKARLQNIKRNYLMMKEFGEYSFTFIGQAYENKSLQI